MKLSITDEFLWDIYKILNSTGDVIDFILNPRAVKFMPGIKDPVFKKYRDRKNKIKFSQKFTK